MGPARKQPDTKTYSGRCAVRLRELREKRHMTVEAVAIAVGRPAKTIYNWEAGISEPPRDALPLLAKIFGLTPRGVLAEK